MRTVVRRGRGRMLLLVAVVVGLVVVVGVVGRRR